MLRSLEIQNFKGIKEGKVDELAQVNILVGRNNSGKSTILDALVLLRSALISQDYLDLRGPQQILERRVSRGQGNFNYDELWFGMQTEVPLVLNATFDQTASLTQEWKSRGSGNTPTSTNLMEGSHPESRRYTWQSQADRGAARTYKQEQNWSQISQQFGEGQATFLGLIHLLDPSGIQFAYAERIWPELIKDRRDTRVTRLLSEIYNTEIEYISFMPHPRQTRLVAALPSTSVAVDWLGDGFRYAVNILSLGIALQGTAFLIEELETHQHPESLRKLTQTLFELAKQQQLQLFLTTHSMELITYALDAAEEKGVEMKLHHLSLDREGSLRSIPFTQPNAQLMLDIGHDPRLHEKYLRASS